MKAISMEVQASPLMETGDPVDIQAGMTYYEELSVAPTAMLAVLADEGARADYNASLSGGCAPSGGRNTIRALLDSAGSSG